MPNNWIITYHLEYPARSHFLHPPLLCAENSGTSRCPCKGKFLCILNIQTPLIFQGLKNRQRSCRNPQRLLVNDVKILISPSADEVLHLRSDASLEVQANVFRAESGGYKQGAYLQSISRHRTSAPRTVAPLMALQLIHAACARVHVCVRINEPPPGSGSQISHPPAPICFSFCHRPGSSPQLSHDDTHTRIEHYANR